MCQMSVVAVRFKWEGRVRLISVMWQGLMAQQIVDAHGTVKRLNSLVLGHSIRKALIALSPCDLASYSF